MNDETDATTIGIISRLARLEGLLVGLQSSISQSQSQWAGSQARVERLEERLVALEARQVTRDDFRALSDKVDALVASEAKQSAGVSLAGWGVTNLAPWLAVVVAVLALVGVGANREALLQQRQQQHMEAKP